MTVKAYTKHMKDHLLEGRGQEIAEFIDQKQKAKSCSVTKTSRRLNVTMPTRRFETKDTILIQENNELAQEDECMVSVKKIIYTVSTLYTDALEDQQNVVDMKITRRRQQNQIINAGDYVQREAINDVCSALKAIFRACRIL
ncbi:hypothetical protein CU097_012533 [Rhizopus azygosporus]|uniref:Uncharacterized protein n=1 Tax=Rhizopus azygosporus TaxID=86630 RepID=A0A367K2Z5_RHIAZ|nr:hypothetical protein CU097_012533 [Rhizopus azygosporus]